MNYRTQTADLLKGIAVLLMIQVHIIELFSTQQLSNSITGKFLFFLGGSFVAPVFMVLLGYFIATSKRITTQLILKGVKIFCLGMVLNILLNLSLIISVNAGRLQIDLLPYVFGVDILQFAGVAIILIALVKHTLEKNIFVSLFGILLCTFLGSYLLRFIPTNISLKYMLAFFYGSSTWSYFPLFPWLAYPLTGFLFYQLKQRYDLEIFLTTKIKIVSAVLFLLFLLFTFKYAIHTSSNLGSYYHHGFLFFLWTFLFLAFYSFFIHEINKIAGNMFIIKYIKWLGKNVTLIYVFQWIIIGNIATKIYKTVSSPIHILVYYLAILTTVSLLTYVFTSKRLTRAS